MRLDYIVVQAGGRGSRLEHLTLNKPKALVPVENLPMLFHLFRKFPDKRYVIIADYQKKTLREYLDCFADVKYQVVDASGTGTSAGIIRAVDLLPDGVPFMLIWSDLILPENFTLPEACGNYIGLSQTFTCRWSYSDGIFTEERSAERGVAGLFVFEDKSCLNGVPQSGELVRWMAEQKMRFNEIGLAGTREYGLIADYETLAQEKCRPFNKITFGDGVLTKEPLDEQGKNLAQLERKWYETAISMKVRNIPKIYSYDPLKMELVNGSNVYECIDTPLNEKRAILHKLIKSLKEIHSLEQIPVDIFSLKEAYYRKTMDRLRTIRDLIPLADQKTIKINKRECRNVYYYKNALEQRLESLRCSHFSFIHGDCTFSNIMLKNGVEPIFIDPRGYFGYTEFYGDPNYDWAKLYYSLAGNYDRFNLKDFRLTINDSDIELMIESNQWEELEQEFFALSGTDPEAIKLIHAVIWLSLTTYAWHDYDSICGAFYNGLYYLEEVL